MAVQRFLALKKAFELVWQSSRAWTVANSVLMVLQGVLPLGSLYLTKLMIDTLSRENYANTLRDVLLFLLLAALFTLGSEICNAIARWVSAAQAQVVTDYVQSRLHAKSMALDLEYYENANYYDAFHQAQQEAPYRPTILLNRFVGLGQNGFSLIAIIALLFSLHWGVTGLLFLATFPLFLVRLKYSKKFYRRWKQWSNEERKANYFSHLLTHEDPAKEIRLLNLGDYFNSIFKQLRAQIRHQKIKFAQQKAIAELGTQVWAILIVFTALGFIVFQTVQGAITLGSLVLYYQAFQRGQGLLKETVRNLAVLYENSFFVNNFIDFLNIQPKVADPAISKPLPVPIQGEITLNHVQFHYPHNPRPVLKDINLTLKAGETLAIVGENGAGKSTLVKLLCRLYDPTQGTITLDGIDLKDIALAELRPQFTVVFQDYFRYHLTVQDNIGLGNFTERENLEKIIKVAQWVGVDDAIAKLPQQYQTRLGTEFAEGEELSIGEWQKIAIARCFLRNAPIVILDEPTSALDPHAEAEVLEYFQQLVCDRTAILISHRLSTVKLADRIIVLDQGKISEQGSHAELMEFGGIYARLFNQQAQSYYF